MTTALPTTTSISEVFAGADQVALATVFAAKAVARSLSYSLDEARSAVFGKVADVLAAYKVMVPGGGPLTLSENLRMFPVLILALLKTVSGHLLVGIVHVC
jgi:protein transport protein SEC24